MPATIESWNLGNGKVLQRHYQPGSANVTNTLVGAAGRGFEILYATIAYDAAPTYASTNPVIVYFVDGSIQYKVADLTTNDLQYVVLSPNHDTEGIPSRNSFPVEPGDSWYVQAPAGGVGITSYISVYVLVDK